MTMAVCAKYCRIEALDLRDIEFAALPDSAIALGVSEHLNRRWHHGT